MFISFPENMKMYLEYLDEDKLKFHPEVAGKISQSDVCNGTYSSSTMNL